MATTIVSTAEWFAALTTACADQGKTGSEISELLTDSFFRNRFDAQRKTGSTPTQAAAAHRDITESMNGRIRCEHSGCLAYIPDTAETCTNCGATQDVPF